jgi:flagellar motor protein MotB
MKLGYLISTAFLCLFLMGAVPSFAQQDEHPAQAEDKKDQDLDKKQDEKAQDKDKDKDKEKDKEKDKDKPDEKALNKDEHQDQMSKSAHADDAHAKEASAGRIPEDKFHASFGREHTFVMSKTVIVEHQTRFVQSGYTFVMAQPWPAAWVATTPVYIDFIGGGYYLICPAQPSIQISLSVVL